MGFTLSYHPTKGLRSTSDKRARAAGRMARILDHVLFVRKKPPRYPNVYRFQKRTPPKRWPDTETRQQRRYAERRAAE